ncbi:MAG: SpoIIE family protein phosphatase [Planctomycetota bacterium]
MLLGRDHRLFGAIATEHGSSGDVAAAICAGGVPDERFFRSKGDPAFPNEDACCFVDDGRRLLLAVADAHFGRSASERFIEAVATAQPPADPAAFRALLADLDRLAPEPQTASSTTLIVAVLDRTTREAMAASYGDSSLLRITAGGATRAVPRGARFLVPGEALGEPEGLLSWRLQPHEVVVLHSDGIDEAFGSHGGVMPKDVARLCALCGGDPVLLARAIAAAALQGPIDDPSVDGGRDNVAVLVARP